MRILCIAPRLPLPADTGGKIRTWNILHQLTKTAKVHLVCFSFDAKDSAYASDMEAAGIQVTLVPAQDLGVCKKIIQGVFNPRPVSVAKYCSREMEKTLFTLLGKYSFDAVHIDHAHMAPYRAVLDGLSCVLDEHNVEYKILERCAVVERSWFRKIVFKQQAKKMERFERRSIGEVAAYLAVSEEDKMLLDQLKGDSAKGFVVPNGVDTEHYRTQDTRHKTQEEEAVVFTGSMDWLPNRDAAVYFIEAILPLIWKQRPQVKFYIVGKGPAARLAQHARKDKRIIVTGCVDDVRVYMRRSKVFVVPLRIGGGTRLKILEAMSMQKAVVSTRIGAEGIEYSEERNIVIADEPAVFAEKVLALLEDSREREILGNAGRALVLEKYDWNIVGKKLATIYEHITEKK